jgi:prevent-host-death family protein
MELSVREARAQFSKAIEAARRGERVVITRNGHPVAELGPPRAEADSGEGLLERLARIRKELGIKTVDFDPWPAEFNDPAFSREVLMLDEHPDIEPK